MRTLLLMNPKGGSGKSTLATNLAALYATRGLRVALVDLDRQGSSRDWLAARPGGRPLIARLKVDPDEKPRLPDAFDVVVYDAPAGLHGKDLKRHARLAQTLLIPVLPSPLDTRACARFIEELLLVGRIGREATRLAVIANRVREGTRACAALQRFLASLHIPLPGALRDSQNYVRAVERGLGICELPPALAAPDLAQWQPILDWLESPAAVPAGAWTPL